MKTKYAALRIILPILAILVGGLRLATARAPAQPLESALLGSIHGYVSDPTGSPEGLHLDLLLNGRQLRQARISAEGEFFFGALPEGHYRLRVLDRHGQLRALEQDVAEILLAEGQRVSELNLVLSIAPPAPAPQVQPASVEATGQITGVVTDSDTGLPLGWVFIELFSVDGVSIITGGTDPAGHYVFAGLLPGGYKVQFEPGTPYAWEWYSAQTSFDSAAVVNVASGGTTSNVNANLIRGGQISGTVTAADSALPMANIYLEVYDSSGFYAGGGTTDSAGHYNTAALRSGNYRVRFTVGINNQPYLPTYYHDKDTLDSADVVAVVAPNVTSGIDAALKRSAQIAGRITAADTGLPLPGAAASAYDCAGVRKTWTNADASGYYTITRGLPTGAYRILFSPWSSYLPEAYNNRPNLLSADLVTVTAPNLLSNVNAALDPGGAISGTVTAADTGLPLDGVTVSLFASDDNFIVSTSSDISGHYLFADLPSGSYRLRFRAARTTHYVPEYYDHKPNLASADPLVLVAPNTVSAVDFALRVGAPIRGAVTTSDTHEAVEVRIQVYSPTGQRIESSTALTYTGGIAFQTSALLTGTYRVLIRPAEYAWDYGFRYFNQKSTLAAADDIHVTVPAGATISGTLDIGGHIAGNVAGIKHWPGEFPEIFVYDSSGLSVATVFTPNQKRYVSSGLPSGDYRVQFDASLLTPLCTGAYPSQYYFEKLDLASADLVNVQAPKTTDNINVLLNIVGRFFLPLLKR